MGVQSPRRAGPPPRACRDAMGRGRPPTLDRLLSPASPRWGEGGKEREKERGRERVRERERERELGGEGEGMRGGRGRDGSIARSTQRQVRIRPVAAHGAKESAASLRRRRRSCWWKTASSAACGVTAAGGERGAHGCGADNAPGADGSGKSRHLGGGANTHSLGIAVA